jgi:hypothetical protein
VGHAPTFLAQIAAPGGKAEIQQPVARRPLHRVEKRSQGAGKLCTRLKHHPRVPGLAGSVDRTPMASQIRSPVAACAARRQARFSHSCGETKPGRGSSPLPAKTGAAASVPHCDPQRSDRRDNADRTSNGQREANNEFTGCCTRVTTASNGCDFASRALRPLCDIPDQPFGREIDQSAGTQVTV